MASVWNEEQLRKYDFSTESLPRLNYTDKLVDKLIADGVIIFLCTKNSFNSDADYANPFEFI